LENEPVALKWKPKKDRVRLIWTSEAPGPFKIEFEDNAKVFGIIGPLDNFTDKRDLQDALETFLRGYNLKKS
jgi:hypothetical protein